MIEVLEYRGKQYLRADYAEALIAPKEKKKDPSLKKEYALAKDDFQRAEIRARFGRSSSRIANRIPDTVIHLMPEPSHQSPPGQTRCSRVEPPPGAFPQGKKNGPT